MYIVCIQFLLFPKHCCQQLGKSLVKKYFFKVSEKSGNFAKVRNFVIHWKSQEILWSCSWSSWYLSSHESHEWNVSFQDNYSKPFTVPIQLLCTITFMFEMMQWSGRLTLEMRGCYGGWIQNVCVNLSLKTNGKSVKSQGICPGWLLATVRTNVCFIWPPYFPWTSTFCVVMSPPFFNQDLRLAQAVEDLAV